MNRQRLSVRPELSHLKEEPGHVIFGFVGGEDQGRWILLGVKLRPRIVSKVMRSYATGGFFNRILRMAPCYPYHHL